MCEFISAYEYDNICAVHLPRMLLSVKSIFVRVKTYLKNRFSSILGLQQGMVKLLGLD